MKIVAINVGVAAPLFVAAASGATGAHETVMSGIRKSPVSTLSDPRAVAVDRRRHAARRGHGVELL